MDNQTEPQILTLDVGLIGCQASIVSISGVISDTEFNKIDLIYPYSGGIELDPDALWEVIVQSISTIAGRSQLNYGQFVAICCSVSLDGMIPVDAEGHALRYASIWNEWRSKKDRFSVFKGWRSTAGMSIKKIKQWAKIHEGENYPGFQEPAAQLLLFREMYPDLYPGTYKFVSILDYLNFKLTGRFVSTPDSTLINWVMDSRNSILETFSHDLLRDRGIDENKLNEIVPNSAVIGELQQGLAESTRLPVGMRVVAGAMTGITSILGAGAVDDFQPFYYLGSSSWIEVHLPDGNWSSSGGIRLNPSAIPGRQILSSVQPAATVNLNYLRDMIFFPVDELTGVLPPEDTFQIMDRMAAKSPPGSNGLLYIPLLKGENGNSGNKHCSAVLLNLTLSHSRSDIIRAVMEGVALNARQLLAPFEKSIGRKFTRLNMAGGGTKATVWCQIFADILNIPIRQISDPGNVNSRGAAVLAAIGLGYLSYDDAARAVQYQLVFSPKEENRDLYDSIFNRYSAHYRKNLH